MDTYQQPYGTRFFDSFNASACPNSINILFIHSELFLRIELAHFAIVTNCVRLVLEPHTLLWWDRTVYNITLAKFRCISFNEHLSVYRFTHCTKFDVWEQYFSALASELGNNRAFFPTKNNFSPQRSAFSKPAALQTTTLLVSLVNAIPIRHTIIIIVVDVKRFIVNFVCCFFQIKSKIFKMKQKWIIFNWVIVVILFLYLIRSIVESSLVCNCQLFKRPYLYIRTGARWHELSRCWADNNIGGDRSAMPTSQYVLI